MDKISEKMILSANKYSEYHLSNDKLSNVAFSPYSLHMLLSLIQIGSDEATRENLKSFLGVDFETAVNSVSSLTQKLVTLDSSVKTNNKLYSKILLKQQYLDSIEQKFKATVEKIDFSNKVESALIINKWVEEATENLIKNIINPEDIDEMTALIFVNTLLFKGKWLYQFEKNETFEHFFECADEKSTKVKYMHKSRKYKFLENEKYKMLELPYSDNRYSAIYVLPKDKCIINTFKTATLIDDLKDFNKNGETKKVDVMIPKLKVNNKSSLEKFLTLENLGILFDPCKCNLSKMSDINLHISKVVQCVNIEFDEEGTVAAAATAAIALMRCSFDHYQFHATSPFIVYIWDATLEAPLFVVCIQNL